MLKLNLSRNGNTLQFSHLNSQVYPQNIPLITCIWIGFFLTSFVLFISENFDNNSLVQKYVLKFIIMLFQSCLCAASQNALAADCVAAGTSRWQLKMDQWRDQQMDQ